MKRIRLTGIAPWARGGGWRGAFGALAAISLRVEPIPMPQFDPVVAFLSCTRRTLRVLRAALPAFLRFGVAALKSCTPSRSAVCLFALVLLLPSSTDAQAQTAPEITSGGPFTVAEGTTAVATLTASDEDTATDQLVWTIPEDGTGGADADQFTLSSAGDLAFSAVQDYENPDDADGDRTYEVTVQVSDGNNTDTEDVVVTVKNADEEGTVSLFPAQLRVRTVVRATLTDPDGDLDAVSWRWAESSDKTTWTDIDGATQADYLPTEATQGKYLQAEASYGDGEGSNKTSRTESNAVVGAREPGPELSVKTLVSGLRFPWGIAFTPDGTMLFTERDGHRNQKPPPESPEGLSSRLTDGTLQTVSADFSDLDTDENGGVMGLEVDPDFVDNRRIYICQQRTGSVIQVVAWTIDATYTTATRANDPLVGNIPRVDNHNGCRLRFGPDGNLWISTGDTEAIGTVPQDLNSLGGKILRVDPLTGAAPADNPFPGSLVYLVRSPQPAGPGPEARYEADVVGRAWPDGGRRDQPAGPRRQLRLGSSAHRRER